MYLKIYSLYFNKELILDFDRVMNMPMKRSILYREILTTNFQKCCELFCETFILYNAVYKRNIKKTIR